MNDPLNTYIFNKLKNIEYISEYKKDFIQKSIFEIHYLFTSDLNIDSKSISFDELYEDDKVFVTDIRIDFEKNDIAYRTYIILYFDLNSDKIECLLIMYKNYVNVMNYDSDVDNCLNRFRNIIK